MKKIILLLAFVYLFSNELIFYCGMTMRKPMREIADIFEKENSVKVKMVVGGSKSLLEKIETLKNADLYLPGSQSYILKHKDLFKQYKYIGYNQLALIVKKNNPKSINSVNDLKKRNLIIVMCNPELSSCGKASKKFLKKDFNTIYFKACDIVLDSKPLNNAVKKSADAGLNWKATAKWPGNRQFLDVIDIGAKKKELLLSIPKYTNNYKLAIKFLDLATSEKGKRIMKKYGFLDEQ